MAVLVGKEHEQHAVAKRLATTAASFQPDFIMTTGDIIYKGTGTALLRSAVAVDTTYC